MKNFVTPARYRLIAALLALSTVSGFAQSGAANTNPNHLLPPNIGELTAKWWKWALETPAATNPLIDQTGVDCAVGQSGNVWFLAGSFGSTVTRSCTIPASKVLFIPVINNIWIPFKTDPIRNAVNSRMLAALDPATITMSAQIDGVPVMNLQDYRAQAKAFTLVLPADNIVGEPKGPYGPCAGDGYYLPIAGLSAGPHTVHVFSQSPATGTTDVTVNVLIL